MEHDLPKDTRIVTWYENGRLDIVFLGGIGKEISRGDTVRVHLHLQSARYEVWEIYQACGEWNLYVAFDHLPGEQHLGTKPPKPGIMARFWRWVSEVSP